MLAKKIKNRMRQFMDNLSYGSFGRDSRIIKPMRILGKRRIYIGNGVTILNLARIETLYAWGDVELKGKLTIGDNTSFEQCCHVIAAKNITIGKGCVFSAFVYISDCSHGYNPNEGIMESDLNIKPVRIGDHCFVGIGSSILPGVTIGNNVVIGANSVVTKDIPDNSMAVGCPARMIKKYDNEKQEWVSLKNE